jgi:signal transduction histidine kinase/ActR/RegA family two-component response regulator
MIRALLTLLAAVILATYAKAQDAGGGLAGYPRNDAAPIWIHDADAIAAEIVARKLFVGVDDIDALEARARARAAQGDLDPMRYLVSYLLVLSHSERAGKMLGVYAEEANRLASARDRELSEIFRAYAPALDGRYHDVVKRLTPLVDSAEDPIVIGVGAQLLAYSLADAGRPAQALKPVHQGLEKLRGIENVDWIVAALRDAWRYAVLGLGDYETAIMQTRLSLGYSLRSGFPVDGVTILYNLATTTSKAGLHGEAERFAQMERVLAAETGLESEKFFSDLLCAQIARNAEKYAQAADCALRALNSSAAPAEYMTQARAAYVVASARLGKKTQAREAFNRLEIEADERNDTKLKAILKQYEAEVLFAEGDSARAFVLMRDFNSEHQKAIESRFNAGVKELRASLEAELNAAEERAAAKTREAELIKRRADLQRTLLGLVGMIVIAAGATLVFMRNYARSLAAARANAESANRSKSEFLASMSHELRTPLNGVLGMAQILHTNLRDPAEREQVKTILDSGRTLTAILNDILDLSKIEAGKLDISPVDDDLPHALRRLVHLFEPQAREKGLILTLTIDDKAPRWMRFDPVRVRQCVANLVSNAVKFTDSGEVRINVGAAETASGYDVTVAVRDTGVGMDDAVLAKLFTPFTQADASVTRRFGGTGLGLTITRRLARMMGGDVVAASAPGFGTTMTLTFVAEKASQAPRERPLDDSAERRGAGAVLRGKTVLIVDDIMVNRQVAALFLAPFGAKIVHAASGAEALALVERETIDAVLMDVQMPGMDGYEATRRIRALGGRAGAAPIIALTAEAMEGDREKCLAAGMNDYAPKPLDARTLLAAISRAMTDAKSAAA